MSFSKLIKTSAIALGVLSVSTPIVLAADLTPAEQSVCLSLRICLDIISRHDASEFDYAVLEAELGKFGPSGKTALFKLLESENGHADIAQLILAFGPLTLRDRQRVQARWSQEKAKSYLPLLLDGHPMSRDLLLRSLGHPNAEVREQVRVALLRLPASSKRAPLPKTLHKDLLSSIKKDPIAQAAPYLAQINSAGHEKEFAALLNSGDADIVAAAYSALYRNSPAQAFNILLAEMKRIQTSVQARAIGQMLVNRHEGRRDGFYLKFARDMSGDASLPISARASGLHAVIKIAEGSFPELNSARAEALAFLLKGQPFIAQDRYLPYLKSRGAEPAMKLIWDVAQSEKWINRDRVAEYYKGLAFDETVTRDLLQSDDIRLFSAGVRRAKPNHMRFVREQIDHPIDRISKIARKTLDLPPRQMQTRPCSIRPYDLEDMRAQMPFFDSGWIITRNKARTSLSRSSLTTAHPSSSGWLAGYDLIKSKDRSLQAGGALLHYDNTSGAFTLIESFQGPVAILPDRPLPLGQTTNQFWVVDVWDSDVSDNSVYRVDLANGNPMVTHVGVLPRIVQEFSIAANGDLLVTFGAADQKPLRLSPSGKLSMACAVPRLSNATQAPN